jgi:hypothetical protein
MNEPLGQPAADDRLTETPACAAEPFRPIQVPDLRLRRPLRRRILTALGLIVLAGVVLGLGYAGFRWLQRKEVERVVRTGFTQQGVAAVHLERKGDGLYTGTLTTVLGEDWDVTARMGANRQITWRARPPLARFEADLRRDMESKLNKRVRSVKLVRQPDGRYAGLAEMESGEQFDVREESDGPHLFVYEWNQATVEKWVHQVAGERYNDRLSSLALTRRGPTNYAGKASGTSGLEYDISIAPGGADAQGSKAIHLNIDAVPASFGRWVTLGLQKRLKIKVKKMTLTPQPGGYSTGQAISDKGEVYDIRAGTPPAWRKKGRFGLAWQAALAPASYKTWLANTLEKVLLSKVKSLDLVPDRTNIYIARLENDRRFEVALRTRKLARSDEEDLWPDLPHEEIAVKYVKALP